MIWETKRSLKKGSPFWNIGRQAILCDLFGMVRWPFQGLSDLQLGDEKGHFESPGMGFFFILSHISHGGFWVGGSLQMICS